MSETMEDSVIHKWPKSPNYCRFEYSCLLTTTKRVAAKANTY